MSNRLQWRTSYLLVAAALLGALGCGSSNVPVAGKLQWEDGGPVDGALIRFVPVSGTLEAEGFTDKDGEFTLKTASAPGAPPGEYKVCVTKAAGRGYTGKEPGKDELATAMQGAVGGKVGETKPPDIVEPPHEKYRDEKSTPLSWKVEPGKKAEFKIAKAPKKT